MKFEDESKTLFHLIEKFGEVVEIEKNINIKRPQSIADIDGYEAVILYDRWQRGDDDARDLLIKYCKADTLSTYILTMKLLNEAGISVDRVNPDELFKKALK